MNIKESVKEYLGLKSDAFKLGLVENLSLVINQFLSTFLLLLVLLVALVFLLFIGHSSRYWGPFPQRTFLRTTGQKYSQTTSFSKGRRPGTTTERNLRL